MVSADMFLGIEVSQSDYGFEATIPTTEYADGLKPNSVAPTQPLHTTKQVIMTIKEEQRFIKELEIKADKLEAQISSRAVDERGEDSCKRPRLELETELENLKRTIRSRNFSLKVARAAFAQFMLAEDGETIDLSDVVELARETYLDETDSSMEESEGHLKEMFESMIATLGLYIIVADNWSFRLGFLTERYLDL